MKYIKYIIIFITSFVFICTVHAEGIWNKELISYTYQALFYNCVSNDNCTPVSMENYTPFSPGTLGDLNSIPNSSGIAFSFYYENGFIKDHVYSVTIYVNPYTSATTYTTNNMRVGVGNVGNFQKAELISSSESYGITLISGGTELYEQNGNLLTYTFKSPVNGNNLFLTMTTNVNHTHKWHVSGYKLFDHGEKVPTAEEIKNSLNSNFENIEGSINDVNNNINNVNNNINNVQDRLDDLDNSINSEDSNIESGKCGIVCKLKGIFTGIVNLPSLIWEKLKAGFDAISDGLKSLFDGIKNLFTPEEKCEKSNNLFNIDSTVNSYDAIKDNIDNGIKVSSTSKSKGYVRYNLGDASLYENKKFTLSADITGSKGKIEFCYFIIGSITCFSSLSSSGSTSFIGLKRPEGSVLYLHFYSSTEYGDSNATSEYKNIMFNEGDISIPYEPYGETCTGGGTLFDWFGNFFKSLISGILELPGKLVSLLLDGLKALFVPTDDQLYEIINDSKELTENFGFVGESMNFFLNIFTSLLGLVNANGCVELPEFTIGETSLFEAHTFWNAQNVCLADNAILSNNITTIRTITSIVLVGLFINFAVSKFFNILNKNDNDQARMDSYDLR